MTPEASKRVSWEVVTKTSWVAGSGRTSVMASVTESTSLARSVVTKTRLAYCATDGTLVPSARRMLLPVRLAVRFSAQSSSAATELRLAVDEMETLTSRACWPYPSYGDLLFSVR